MNRKRLKQLKQARSERKSARDAAQAARRMKSKQRSAIFMAGKIKPQHVKNKAERDAEKAAWMSQAGKDKKGQSAEAKTKTLKARKARSAGLAGN